MFVKFGRIIGCQNVGIAVYLLFTLLFTSGVFAICFYWMHKKNTKYWIRFTGLAFYGLFPIWSAYARTAVKDTLFYPIFVLFVLFIFDIVLEPEKIFDSKVKSILFLIVSLLLCLVRHNGFYILIFYDAVLYCRCKKISKTIDSFIYNMVAFLGGLPKSNSSHGRCEAWRKAGDALHPFSTDSEICKILWK